MAIAVSDFDDRPAGQQLGHIALKIVPILFAPEIIAQEESAARQVIANLGQLGFVHVPLIRPGAIEEWPIVDIVAIVGAHRLFHAAHLEASEAAKRESEMAVRARIIVGPGAAALPPVKAVEESEDAPVALRVHHSGEDELGFILVIGRQREIVVLLAFVFAERHLERAQDTGGGEAEGQKKDPPGAHTTMLASGARLAGKGCGGSLGFRKATMPPRSVLPAIIYPGRQRVRWHPRFRKATMPRRSVLPAITLPWPAKGVAARSFQESNYAAALRFAGYYFTLAGKGCGGTLVSGKQLCRGAPFCRLLFTSRQRVRWHPRFQGSNYARRAPFCRLLFTSRQRVRWHPRFREATMPPRSVLPAII